MYERCIYFNSNAFIRALNRVWEEAFESFDLSPPHAYLLRVVLGKPGQSQQGIANELNLARSTVTRFIDALEKRNLVVRHKSATDGREWLIHPTSRAKAMHDDLEATGEALSKKMQALIGKEHFDAIIDEVQYARKCMEEEADKKS